MLQGISLLYGQASIPMLQRHSNEMSIIYFLIKISSLSLVKIMVKLIKRVLLIMMTPVFYVSFYLWFEVKPFLMIEQSLRNQV